MTDETAEHTVAWAMSFAVLGLILLLVTAAQLTRAETVIVGSKLSPPTSTTLPWAPSCTIYDEPAECR